MRWFRAVRGFNATTTSSSGRTVEAFSALTASGPVVVRRGDVLAESHPAVRLMPERFEPSDPAAWSAQAPGPSQVEARRARLVEIEGIERDRERERRRSARLAAASAEERFWRGVDELLHGPRERDESLQPVDEPPDDAESFWSAVEQRAFGYSEDEADELAGFRQLDKGFEDMEARGARREADALREAAGGWPGVFSEAEDGDR